MSHVTPFPSRADDDTTPSTVPHAPLVPLPENAPLRIKELLPMQIEAVMAGDPRLIIPVGTCEQHGPHLPLGTATIIAERLADDLSAEFGVLRAPAVEYGVNVDTERGFTGNASVRKKTLHRISTIFSTHGKRRGSRNSFFSLRTVTTRIRKHLQRSSQPARACASWTSSQSIYPSCSRARLKRCTETKSIHRSCFTWHPRWYTSSSPATI